MCTLGIESPKNEMPGILNTCTLIFATKIVSTHKSAALMTQLKSPKVIIFKGKAISCKMGLSAKDKMLKSIPPRT